MDSPPLELALDVVHITARNLLRNQGEADGDTISEITRAIVYSHPWGPAIFTAGVFLVAAGFVKHILK